MKMETILSWLSFLRKRIYYIDGLVVLLIIVGVGYSIAVSNLGSHLNAFMTGCGYHLSSAVKHGVYLGGLLVVEILAILFWFNRRSLPRFKKNELGIIFAPNFPEDLEQDVGRLFSHLVYELKSNQFGNRFTVKKLPPNKTISSHEEASAITRKCHAIGAVWGLMESQLSANGKKTGFSTISFTVVHRPARIGPGFHRRLFTSMVGKRWHIEERNQIVDRKLLAHNIGLVIRNLIGLALMIDLRFEDATKIFLPLCRDTLAAIGPNSPVEFRTFYTNVKTDAAFCLMASTELEYLEYLRTNRLYSIPENKLEIWLNNVNEAIKLDRQNSNLFLMKALYLFLLEKVQESLVAVKQARNLAPKAMSGPNFSLAFLYNFNGDFERAGREYKKALAKKTSYETEMLHNILTFIRQTIVRFPQKLQLQFALGLLEMYRGDPEVGRQEMIKFLDKAKAISNLKDFVEEGQRLLAKDKKKDQG